MRARAWLFLAHILLIQGLESRKVDSTLQRQKRIVNGQDVVLGEFPYQVSIQNLDSSYHHCGGTIIDEYHVLTAAHCLDGFLPAEFKLISGTVDLRKPYFTNYVSDLFVHKDFSLQNSWIHDIALMKVKYPFVFNDIIAPARLSDQNEDVPIHTNALVSGFGRLGEHTYTSKILKKAEISIESLEYCNQRYEKNRLRFKNSQICAYNPQPKGICKGDSGGPLTLHGKVIGISSYTIQGCADANYPSVFTKISTYIDWIRQYTKL